MTRPAPCPRCAAALTWDGLPVLIVGRAGDRVRVRVLGTSVEVWTVQALLEAEGEG